MDFASLLPKSLRHWVGVGRKERNLHYKCCQSGMCPGAFESIYSDSWAVKSMYVPLSPLRVLCERVWVRSCKCVYKREHVFVNANAHLQHVCVRTCKRWCSCARARVWWRHWNLCSHMHVNLGAMTTQDPGCWTRFRRDTSIYQQLPGHASQHDSGICETLAWKTCWEGQRTFQRNKQENSYRFDACC